MTRTLSFLIVALVAASACSGASHAPDAPRAPGAVRSPDAPPPGREPRLVVLLVVDQLPEWAFEAKRAALTGGFARLLREGEWHIGQHPSAATLTAPGHALLGTGVPSNRSGIIANEWWRRDLERALTSVQDENGAATTRWLRVPTVADSLVAAKRGGKAVSISLKDRSAILPVGRGGTAIWYDAKSVAWTSITANALTPPPPWLAAWNAARPISAHLSEVWTPLVETPALAGIPDDAPGERGEKELGVTFPHAAAKTSDPGSALYAMPVGNDLVLDTALAAIGYEQLGADPTADLLVISLSSNDYACHGWGHESWEAWDMLLRLDRRLDRFLAELDAKVGAGQWAMLVTSDHGASPLPEVARGGRITLQQIADAANRAATAELGPGAWIASVRYPTVYLSAAARAQRQRELTIATTKIVYALRSFPGMARVEKSAEFWGRCETRTGDAQLLCLALDPERSGEIVFTPKAGWLIHDATSAPATSHGSMHPYDRQVPVFLLPPGRSPKAAADAPSPAIFELTRVAPLLAHWLGVTPPTELPR